jgi:HAE1 family hydrophobic/amphiphilic exporter-1
VFISDFAIRQPVVTIVTMLALVAFGLYALLQLETDEFPDIQAPVVVVTIPYPGADPTVVEREVLDRVEEAIRGIDGIDEVQSSAVDGLALIIATFVFDKSVEEASQDVRDAISSIRGELPPEIEEPVIRRFDPADLPIVSLTLSSPVRTPAELTRLADPGITSELRGLQGVAQVTVVGGAERELTILVRPDALASARVSLDQLVQAIQAQSLAAPVGRVTGPIRERSIRLEGRIERPEDFLRVAITRRDGAAIRLGQLASVVDGSEEPRSLALFNGRPAVGIEVIKSRGASTTTVAERVLERVEAIRRTLPADVRLDVVRNAGERVSRSVHDVQRTLVEGAVLTVLVVFLFLNSWRSTVITGLALPISVVSAFIAVWAFGFTLNTMSLLGLSLAIGILIDDAIVVRENIVRHMEMGKDHHTAALEGTDEIGLAVAATTFSIVSVFIPVAFMGGIAGQWFKPFALTIACAVLVSLFVAFSLDPMLSAYWPDPQIEAGRQASGSPVTRALGRFNRWFDRQADRYRGVIAWALDHRLLVIGVAIASLVGAVVLQALFGGFGFVPVSDRSEIDIGFETPPGSSLEYTRLKALELERVVRSHPEVAYTYTTIGGDVTGAGLAAGAVDEGGIYVRLVPRSRRELSQDELGARLRSELARVGGVTAFVYSGGFGGNQKQIQLQLRGPDAETLTTLAERIADVVRQVPGAVDVGLSTRGRRPDLGVVIDRGLAGDLGVTVGQIAAALRPAFAGIDAGDWVDPSGETRDVRIRFAPAFRDRVDDVRTLPLVLTDPLGGLRIIPLEQVAEVREGLGPARIDHLDGDNVVVIGANVQGRSLGEVSRDVDRAVRGVPLPQGYRITQGGEVEDQREVFGNIFLALAFAILVMYLILVVQFGSFVDPIAILLSLPLSMIGVVLALLVTRDTLNIMSLIGVILLAGIVAKNAILLIDFAKWGRERRGLDRRTALIEAGRIRLRPIIMTSVALVAGMTPVALGLGEGADFRAPLGRAVIGGVVTSTLLTLLVIPTVYELLDEGKERAIAWIRKWRGGGGRPEGIAQAAD